MQKTEEQEKGHEEGEDGDGAEEKEVNYSEKKKTYRVERVSKLPSSHIDRLPSPSKLHRTRLWSPLQRNTYHMAGKISTPSPCLQEDSFQWYSA